MTIEEFRLSVGKNELPAGLPQGLRALWEDARGNWNEAHSIVQDLHDSAGSWIHAYLHRKEGDLGNAGYWYRKAGRPNPQDTLEEEWERIVTALL